MELRTWPGRPIVDKKRMLPTLILLLCGFTCLACSRSEPTAAPIESEVAESITEAPTLTDEEIEAVNKAWDYHHENSEKFWALPKLTQDMATATDIVVGVELNRENSEQDFDEHGSWYFSKVRFRVEQVLVAGSLRQGQEHVVMLITLNNKLKPPSDGRTIFFLRQSECERWNVLAASAATATNIQEIETLAKTRKDIPRADWAIRLATHLESHECSGRKMVTPPPIPSTPSPIRLVP